jgi:hypothetical protein
VLLSRCRLQELLEHEMVCKPLGKVYSFHCLYEYRVSVFNE